MSVLYHFCAFTQAYRTMRYYDGLVSTDKLIDTEEHYEAVKDQIRRRLVSVYDLDTNPNITITSLSLLNPP